MQLNAKVKTVLIGIPGCVLLVFLSGQGLFPPLEFLAVEFLLLLV